MVVRFVRIKIAVENESDARLVLVHGQLIAVLVHLSDTYEIKDNRGAWFAEAAFGDYHGFAHRTFSSLDAAKDLFQGPV
jgi:hypothetical protein